MSLKLLSDISKYWCRFCLFPTFYRNKTVQSRLASTLYILAPSSHRTDYVSNSYA